MDSSAAIAAAEMLADMSPDCRIELNGIPESEVMISDGYEFYMAGRRRAYSRLFSNESVIYIYVK